MEGVKINKLKDKVFEEKSMIASDFSFSEKVALVFDDMVSRSAPFYNEMQCMVSEVAKSHLQLQRKVYDLKVFKSRRLGSGENSIRYARHNGSRHFRRTLLLTDRLIPKPLSLITSKNDCSLQGKIE